MSGRFQSPRRTVENRSAHYRSVIAQPKPRQTSEIIQIAPVQVFGRNTTVVVPDSENVLLVREKVHVTPGSSDFTFVLHDRVLGFRDGTFFAAWDLLGRGKLQ